VVLGDALAGTGRSERPAVVPADERAVLDPALAEPGAAVRALVDRRTDHAVSTAPQDVVLAQHARGAGDVGDVGRIGDGVPVLGEGGYLANEHLHVLPIRCRAA